MIVQKTGWWWPEDDINGRAAITSEVDSAIRWLLANVAGRDCIVQAGGNVGVYPVALADHFQTVVTFEPDPVNALCLRRNVEARDSFSRVDVHEAALGEAQGRCGMVEVGRQNCGAHRIDPTTGDIAVYALDELALPLVDAIWLDCEGFELPALKGAAQTIERCNPVIAIEQKGLGTVYGEAPDAASRWLEALGYEQAGKHGNDRIFRRLPR